MMALVAWGMLAFAAAEPADSDVAAVVNGRVVTWWQVDAELRRRAAQIPPGTTLADARRAVLREIAENILIEQAASDARISVRPDEVDEEWRRRVESVGGPERLEIILRYSGITEAEYRKRLERSLLLGKLLRHKYAQFATNPGADLALVQQVTPAEVREYYEAHRDRFEAVDEVRVFQITMRYADEKEKEWRRRMMESALRRIGAGAEPSVVAQAYSDRDVPVGRRWRPDSPDLPSEWRRLLFSELRPGEHSGILDMGDRWVVLVLVERNQRPALSFAEAYPLIHDALWLERSDQNRRALLDLLVREAYIEPPDLFENAAASRR
jgi:hypothetical protein